MIKAKELDPNNNEYMELDLFFYTNHMIDFGDEAPLLANCNSFI
jgi:hypothetical protein